MNQLQELEMKLSVPYNHDPKLVNAITTHPYREYIHNLYFPINPKIFKTGRPWKNIEPDQYDVEVVELVKTLNSLKITSNLLINTFPNIVRYKEAVQYIKMLRQFTSRLSVTVSCLNLAIYIRKSIPDVEIVASTLAFISNPTRARYWQQNAGIKTITVDRMINKKMPIIKSLKSMGFQLSFVLNDYCLPSCPYQIQHGMGLLLYSNNKKIADLYQSYVLERCHHDRQKNLWLMMQTEILPGNLVHYKGIMDIAKIAGRDHDTQYILTDMEYYVETRMLTHRYYHYVEPENAFEKISQCDRVCDNCLYCPKHFEITKDKDNPYLLQFQNCHNY